MVIQRNSYWQSQLYIRRNQFLQEKRGKQIQHKMQLSVRTEIYLLHFFIVRRGPAWHISLYQIWKISTKVQRAYCSRFFNFSFLWWLFLYDFTNNDFGILIFTENVQMPYLLSIIIIVIPPKNLDNACLYAKHKLIYLLHVYINANAISNKILREGLNQKKEEAWHFITEYWKNMVGNVVKWCF